jgi:predicted DNA-binding transcriptional regulator AlpA
MTAFRPDTGRRFSRTRDLCERYGISQRTMYRWVEDGILPQPIHINNRLTGLRQRALEATSLKGWVAMAVRNSILRPPSMVSCHSRIAQ